MTSFTITSSILYEDREIIVCRKPAGIAVQNARAGAMDLESILKNYLAEKAAESPMPHPEKKSPGFSVPYLAVIHRLDQPVEGILVFAKTTQAAKELTRQLTAGEFEKEYLAVTDRRPPAQAGTLEDYLKKDGKTNTSRVVHKDTPGAKRARLTYRLMKELPDDRVPNGIRYLLEIHLDTGRHHQIRVQMSHAGMPLLGDRKYHPEDASGLPLGLCAYKLTFSHPRTKERMCFETVPENLRIEI